MPNLNETISHIEVNRQFMGKESKAEIDYIYSYFREYRLNCNKLHGEFNEMSKSVQI